MELARPLVPLRKLGLDVSIGVHASPRTTTARKMSGRLTRGPFRCLCPISVVHAAIGIRGGNERASRFPSVPTFAFVASAEEVKAQPRAS